MFVQLVQHPQISQEPSHIVNSFQYFVSKSLCTHLYRVPGSTNSINITQFIFKTFVALYTIYLIFDPTIRNNEIVWFTMTFALQCQSRGSALCTKRHTEKKPKPLWFITKTHTVGSVTL